jgi:hypothetical protein
VPRYERPAEAPEDWPRDLLLEHGRVPMQLELDDGQLLLRAIVLALDPGHVTVESIGADVVVPYGEIVAVGLP